jgi:hypothetical protein
MPLEKTISLRVRDGCRFRSWSARARVVCARVGCYKFCNARSVSQLLTDTSCRKHHHLGVLALSSRIIAAGRGGKGRVTGERWAGGDCGRRAAAGAVSTRSPCSFPMRDSGSCLVGSFASGDVTSGSEVGGKREAELAARGSRGGGRKNSDGNRQEMILTDNDELPPDVGGHDD